MPENSTTLPLARRRLLKSLPKLKLAETTLRKFCQKGLLDSAPTWYVTRKGLRPGIIIANESLDGLIDALRATGRNPAAAMARLEEARNTQLPHERMAIYAAATQSRIDEFLARVTAPKEAAPQAIGGNGETMAPPSVPNSSKQGGVLGRPPSGDVDRKNKACYDALCRVRSGLEKAAQAMIRLKSEFPDDAPKHWSHVRQNAARYAEKYGLTMPSIID
jgi:hypothetical protein